MYILRKLVKCGLAKLEIINVYCTIIKPIIDYASVLFLQISRVTNQSLSKY